MSDNNEPDIDEDDDDKGGNVREQDRFLPIANISRIMKKALPANAKIAKDAKETVQECVSEFISFITSEASDKCQREKRKTINGDDLLWAMSTLGFEEYVEPLKVYLHKYREVKVYLHKMIFHPVVTFLTVLRSTDWRWKSHQCKTRRWGREESWHEWQGDNTVKVETSTPKRAETEWTFSQGKISPELFVVRMFFSLIFCWHVHLFTVRANLNIWTPGNIQRDRDSKSHSSQIA